MAPSKKRTRETEYEQFKLVLHNFAEFKSLIQTLGPVLSQITFKLKKSLYLFLLRRRYNRVQVLNKARHLIAIDFCMWNGKVKQNIFVPI